MESLLDRHGHVSVQMVHNTLLVLGIVHMDIKPAK